MKLKGACLALEKGSGFWELVEHAARQRIPIYAFPPMRLSLMRRRIQASLFSPKAPIPMLAAWLKEHPRTPLALLVELPPLSPLQATPDLSLAAFLAKRRLATLNLIRYGVEQHARLLLVTSPSQVPAVLTALSGKQRLLPLQERLAWEAWELLKHHESSTGFPPAIPVPLWEDPIPLPAASDTQVEQLGGSNLPGTLLVDLHLVLEYLREFVTPAVVILGDAKECSMAGGESIKEAFLKGVAVHPSFGRKPGGTLKGIGSDSLVAVNRPVDLELAQLLAAHGAGTVVAPAYELDALVFLRTIPICLLIMRRSAPALSWSQALGRTLADPPVDDRDLVLSVGRSLKVVTRRFPHPQEWRDLLFSWKILRSAPAPGVVVVKEQQVRGVGSGQINRLYDVKVALEQAAQEAQGATLAFRNFVPFKDGVELAGQFGIRAVIQPGGSVRDDEVIGMADCYDIAMVFASGRISRLGAVPHD